MKSKLIIISFTLFFFNPAQAICVPRNKTTPSPSPDTPPNLKPASPKAPTSSPKSPTPSKSPPPSSSPKAPTSSPKAPPSLPKTPTPLAPPPSKSPPPPSSPKVPTPSPPAPKAPSPQQSPSSGPSPDKPGGLDTIMDAIPKLGGGGNSPGIQKICGATDYPDVCSTTLGPLAGPATDISAVLGVAIKAGSDFAKTALDTAEKMATKPGLPPDDASALKDCKDSYDDVVYNFQNAADALPKKDVGTMNTMLSAALTDVGDCQDAFEGRTSPLSASSDTLRKMASNCLAIVEQMPK